ncbi:MAG TPA: ankyrin repeat domain-containing protein [Steroidobacteraceae bacterium]|nr:ankyrin repeat domain-containing protein [Steroidobacteraceae bacterium]
MKLRALLAGAAIATLLVAGAHAAQPKSNAAPAAPAYSSIAEAARSQDWPAVQAMARQPDVELDAAGTEGSTALHFAIHAGEAAVVQALLDAGIDVATRNVAGISPLQLAVTSGDTAITKLLLARGADARALDEARESLLMLAARYGDGEMASALVAAGADLNYVEPQLGQDALMIAVRSGRTPVVAALIAAHAGLNHLTPPGPEPTIRAPGAGGGSTGEGMVRSGVPPEGQRLAGTGKFTALLYAARDGQLEAAKLLVQAGADHELADYNGITPLLMAVSNDHHDIARLLIQAGANVNAADWYGRRPLWAATESRNRDVSSANATTNGVDREAALEVITMLLEKGAEPDARLEHFPPRMGGHAFNMSYVPTVGETALYRASLNNDLPLMRLLLKHGADPLLKTYHGSSPLMAAAGVGWVRGQTFIPGGEAAQLEAVKMLVELGADVNEANDMGLVAVHGAAFRWSDNVISYLVDHGARLDIKDKVGRTAYTWAAGVTIPSTPPEPSPRTMALIEKLVAQGKGSARR